MTKKKVKKTVKKKVADMCATEIMGECKLVAPNVVEDIPLLREIGKVGQNVWENTQKICVINERIDRLVDAISKSKSVKGI